MLARAGLTILLFFCIAASSRGGDFWSPVQQASVFADAGNDQVCDACDAIDPDQWYGGSACDSGCDACGSCVTNSSCCCGLAYWHMPHENCIDVILPRSDLPVPLLKRLVEGRGVPTPLPFGTSIVFTELDRNVEVTDVRLGLGNNVPASVDRVSVPTTKFHASSQIARVDLWVLPCLNLYGLVGHTRSTGNVAVTVERFPLPISPPVELNIPVELTGTTGGWGMTAAIGSKCWFATLDVNKTWTEFSSLDSSLTALVIAPRVGMPIIRPRLNGEIHLGAMWQDTAQTVNLTVDHPILGNGLHVEVDQTEPRPWNFLVGGMWALNERLLFLVEGGMGGRSYVITGITLRH